METLSVVFADIDHFNVIKDQHGHDTGDRVLQRIAKVLDNLSSNICDVARHGGEEFVILFTNQSAEEAQLIVNEARENLNCHDFTNRDNSKKIGNVSFSEGISCLSVDGDSRAMLRGADTSLYEAKAKGRNQVVVHMPVHAKN